MNIENWINKVAKHITGNLTPGEDLALEEFQSEAGFKLPNLLSNLLSRTDGLLLCHGYYRFFSLSKESDLGLSEWNHPEYWRFAWENRVDSFFCFAETAWGDQFSMSYKDLMTSRDGPVYNLDAIDMTAKVFSKNIEDFLDKILNDISDFSQQLTIASIKRDGDIPASQHLIFIPSLLLGGKAILQNVNRMPSRAAMIINGDLYCQLEKIDDNTEIKRLEDYVDQHGRTRLRVVT